jgi:hypothetical protein
MPLHGDEPFDQIESRQRDQHRARARGLFHARGEEQNAFMPAV